MFRDRSEAGQLLGRRLAHLRVEHPVVLGLPRGGVPVAAEVARALDAPLDVLVVRKLGVPFQPELGIGAVAEGGVTVVDSDMAERSGLGRYEIGVVAARERDEMARLVRLYRDGIQPIDISGRTAVIVDDGLATGGTARAAIRAVRARGAAKVILAVPVAPRDTVAELEHEADEVVCLRAPGQFQAVGQWYGNFSQTTDQEVVDLLETNGSLDPGGLRLDPGELSLDPGELSLDPGGLASSPGSAGSAGSRLPGDSSGGGCGSFERDVVIDAGSVELAGRLEVPEGAWGLVVFAHGAGSSRHSPRNRSVAHALQARGMGTLLFDLLTEEEALYRAKVFDIALLSSRLVEATMWARRQPGVGELPVGYFGASTGAAAALSAAAKPGNYVRSVVSRGGRPDLAGSALPLVPCPVLLIVGGADTEVLEMNREAAARLCSVTRLVVVPGATHLFEEPGAMERVESLAGEWFEEHLALQASRR